jgi:hypothetical protein
MTTSPSTPTSNTNAATGHAPSAHAKQIIPKKIDARWSKFSEHEEQG